MAIIELEHFFVRGESNFLEGAVCWKEMMISITRPNNIPVHHRSRTICSRFDCFRSKMGHWIYIIIMFTWLRIWLLGDIFLLWWRSWERCMYDVSEIELRTHYKPVPEIQFQQHQSHWRQTSSRTAWMIDPEKLGNFSFVVQCMDRFGLLQTGRTVEYACFQSSIRNTILSFP